MNNESLINQIDCEPAAKGWSDRAEEELCLGFDACAALSMTIADLILRGSRSPETSEPE